jgi:hypothetical protein
MRRGITATAGAVSEPASAVGRVAQRAARRAARGQAEVGLDRRMLLPEKCFSHEDVLDDCGPYIRAAPQH